MSNQTDDSLPTMREYRVKWEIDVSATNPKEACVEAMKFMPILGNDSDALCFAVRRHDDSEDVPVDLSGDPALAKSAISASRVPSVPVVAVIVEEGLVQNVVSLTPMEYIVVDRDIEGTDPDERFAYISSRDGTRREALGHRRAAECNPNEVSQIAAGLEANQDVVYLTYDQWCKKFKPVRNPNVDDDAPFDGTMFETYGPDLEAVQNANPGCVWTLFDGDDVDIELAEKAGYKPASDGDDGAFVDSAGSPVDFGWIGDGFHFVNRAGYFVTEVPACPNSTYVIYIDDRLAEVKKSEA